MGLRARLALFFVAITVVPLSVAVVALRMQIDDQLGQRATVELANVRDSASAIVTVQRERAGDLATDLVHRDVAGVLDEADPARARAWLLDQLGDTLAGRADFVVVVAADGRPLASVDSSLEPLPAQLAAAVADAASQRSVLSEGLLEIREVRGAAVDEAPRVLGWVVSGLRLDEPLLARLVVGDRAAFVGAGQVTTALGSPDAVPLDALPAPGSTITTSVEGERIRVTTASLDGPDGGLLVLWAPVAGDSPAWAMALAVLVAAVAVAGILGWVLATGIVAPVRRAADVARSVAGGDLSRALEPTGGRELEDLATALNVMSAELAARLAEVERSRDLLRKSLSRLGQTLSSSLDLNRTLAVVVETAMDTFEVDRGVLRLFTPERDALYVKIGRGVDENLPRVGTHEGVVGWIARTGRAVRLPADAEQTPAPVEGEIVGAQQLVVPLRGRGGVLGVISLARDELTRPFTADDLDALGTFASQASGAMENVMLHQEAQRLSVTDPLTGLWNFRYLQLQIERELESASRFDRPVALLVMDLDYFKRINDEWGHQVGDEVLVEVASRMRDATRLPDVVARYGGEEFVALLPGTDLDGATATGERIREALAGVPVAVSGDDGSARQLRVTCSVGVAEFPRHGNSAAALLRSADAAMYTAKRRGRNRVVAASDPEVLMEGQQAAE